MNPPIICTNQSLLIFMATDFLGTWLEDSCGIVFPWDKLRLLKASSEIDEYCHTTICTGLWRSDEGLRFWVRLFKLEEEQNWNSSEGWHTHWNYKVWSSMYKRGNISLSIYLLHDQSVIRTSFFNIDKGGFWLALFLLIFKFLFCFAWQKPRNKNAISKERNFQQ